MPAVFALHSTVAAVIALSLAASLHLPHPWWAAMTVWLVAQPTRGLFAERCLARLCGTAVGCVVGGALLLAFAHNRFILLTTLAIWVMACSAAGATLRHFRSYAAVLAGYTASIVALFGFAEGEFDVSQAVARLACTVIGIGVSALVSTAFYRRGDSTANGVAVTKLLERCRQWCDMPLEYRGMPEAKLEAVSLARDAALLERTFENNAAGSMSARRSLGVMRDRLNKAIEILAISCLCDREGVRSCSGACEPAMPKQHRAVFQADVMALYSGLLRVAARPGIAIALAGALWLASGWHDGPIMVMTAALFAALFSSHERATSALRTAMLGTVIGALAGLAFRVLIMPAATGYAGLLLASIPFLATGAYLIARPCTAKMAIDMNMTFLLIAQPSLPLPSVGEAAALEAIAMFAGICIAWLTYAAILPAEPGADALRLAKRMQRLALAMACETRPGALRRHQHAMTDTFVSLCAGEQCRAQVISAGLSSVGWACLLLVSRRGSAAAVESQLSAGRAQGLIRATANLGTLISSQGAKLETSNRSGQ